MARPYVLKPVNEGSSVGVAIVTDEQQLRQPDQRARPKGRGCISTGCWPSRSSAGRELTVAVLGGEALCVTELKPKAGFYDFDAKYTDGLTDMSARPRCRANIAEAMMDMALARAPLARLQGRVALATSAGTTSRARRASICSRSTPSRA